MIPAESPIQLEGFSPGSQDVLESWMFCKQLYRYHIQILAKKISTYEIIPWLEKKTSIWFCFQ